MPVTIENLTDRPVMLHFNSCRTMYLGPNATLEEILDVELRDNAKIKRLQDRHVIALHGVVKKARPAAPKKEKAEAPKEKVEIPKEKKQKENKEKSESTKGKITV